MKTETRIAFGAKVKDLLKRDGATTSSFALMIGIDRGHFGRILEGEVSAGIDTCEKIARGFDISLSELFEGIGSPGAPVDASQIDCQQNLPDGAHLYAMKLPRE